MNKKTKEKLKEIAVNTASLLGVMIPEKYPPTTVLVPQKKFPFLKPITGSKYYQELKRKRGL